MAKNKAMKKKKIQKVMHEFAEGELHSGSPTGPKVNKRSQALAIAISESKKKKKKEEMTKKTFGQHILENQGADDGLVSPHEYQQAQEKNYLETLRGTVESGKKHFHGVFFVEVIMKKEPLFDKTFRNFFVPRQSCPTPFFEQTVYRFNPEDDNVEFIWSVPDKDTCIMYLNNANKVPKEEQDLLHNIIAFANNDLYYRMQLMNNEIAQDETKTLRKELADGRRNDVRTIIESV